ncbi:hypothetical protein [Microbacterium gilvum]|uniref:Tail assembly chaperone n=1 Tax=Microbacterium gilvum TaxID=1336204 RepID=A0ABP9A7F4_9MICO
MLALALHYHEGALRASLMEVYGLRLADMRDMFELSDLVQWLPAGCAFWRSFGGPAAVTEQTRAIQMLDYSVRVADYHARHGKGKKPKPPQDPPFAHEKRAQQEKFARQAETFRRIQERTEHG